MRTKYIQYTIVTVVVLVMIGCKTPQPTQTTDYIKMQLPANIHQDSIAKSQDTIASWRQFFTDPTLTELIDTALSNNQDLRITLQQIAIAKSNVLYAQGQLLPTLTAGGNVGVSKSGRYTSEGAGNATTNIKPGKDMPNPLMDYQLGVNVNWEIDLWNKLSSSKKAAVEQYLASVEGRNAVLSSLIAQVASNYYHLLALDNKLELIHQYIEIQKQAVQIAKVQKSADTETELAVKKFEAELAKSLSEEFTLKQEITETENNLNLLLGRYPTTIQRNKETFLSLNVQKFATNIPSQLLNNRADVRQAEHELAAAKLNVQVARKEFLPSINISASLGLDAFNPTYLTKLPQSLAFSVIGGLTQPLINRKAIQANFQSADAQQIEALYQYDKTLLTAYSEACTLMSKIKNLDQYYQLKLTQANTLDQSISIARQLYMNNRCTYLDVLMDQRDALEAKIELLEAKEDQLSSIVNLYHSLGGGSN